MCSDKSDINLKEHVENIIDIISINYNDAATNFYDAAADTICNNDTDYTSYTDCVPMDEADPCIFSVANTTKFNWTEGSLLKHFADESELESYIIDDKYGQIGWENGENGALRPIAFAIVFKSVSNDGKIWDYSLRFDYWNDDDRIPQTFTNNEYTIVNIIEKDISELYDNTAYKYLKSGFLDLQSMIDIAITQYIAIDINGFDDVNKTYLQEFVKGWFIFPMIPIEIDTYWDTWGLPFQIFSAIMFVYPVIQIISVLVNEKSTKIKEGMKMMGASSSIYWSSMYLWFIFEFTTICIIVTTIAFTMDIFLYSDNGLIWLWFWLFCISQMTFSTLISTFFDNPKTATIVGFVLYFLFVGLGQAMTNMT